MQLLYLDCLLGEDNGSGMLCLCCSAATDFKLLPRFRVVRAFYPVKLCAVMIGVSQDCPRLITVV